VRLPKAEHSLVSAAPQYDSSPDAYLARQPIFDARHRVVAFEILFRRGHVGSAGVVGTEESAQTLINALLEVGLQNLVGERKAFVNVPLELLSDHLLVALPPERVVIEILETTQATPEAIRAVQDLKSEGYMFAVDDYTFQPELQPFVQMADILKFDIQDASLASARRHAGGFKYRGMQLLAEKVETLDEFEQWREIGFDLFQGYFLSKPTLLHSRRTQFNQGAVMQLMSRLQDPDVSLTTLEDIISTDVSLSVGLLRFVHSASVGAPPSLNSIRQAVMILGIKRTAAIVSLLSLSNVSGKAPALIANALQRAKMCELLAKSHRMGNLDQYFTTGLLSLLDCFLGMEMSEIVEQLPLSEGIKSALLGSDDESEIARVLCAATRYERADWEAIEGSEFDPADLSACYVESLQWSDEIAATMNGVS